MGNILSNRDCMMNEVINTLIQYQATKTGYHSQFTGIKDFSIDELEMLDFLFENCPETIEVFTEVCKKYKVEFEKASSVSWLVMQTTFNLNKIYHFGWLNSNKVDNLDTITDISQIPMKERYSTYLNKLRVVNLEIDKMFIEAYNQCQPHLNILRVEQCFSYLREELEYQGIQTEYGDYSVACPHGVGRPYFSRANYGYYIVDNNDCYGGRIFLSPNNNESNLEWTYMASQSPDSWHTNKALAEVKVQQLRELRDLAGLSKELEWTVVYANSNDLREKDPFRGMDWVKAHCNGQTKFIHVPVSNGMKGKHRQSLKEICKKYNPIIDEINAAFRASKVGVTS